LRIQLSFTPETGSARAPSQTEGLKSSGAGMNRDSEVTLWGR
jgi:hypothetical protein